MSSKLDWKPAFANPAHSIATGESGQVYYVNTLEGGGWAAGFYPNGFIALNVESEGMAKSHCQTWEDCAPDPLNIESAFIGNAG